MLSDAAKRRVQEMIEDCKGKSYCAWRKGNKMFVLKNEKIDIATESLISRVTRNNNGKLSDSEFGICIEDVYISKDGMHIQDEHGRKISSSSAVPRHTRVGN